MNMEPLINAIKNHELVILEPNQVRQLLGIKRLDNDAISELAKELDKSNYVIIPIRYNSSSNGLTNVRKVVIIRKSTYLRIVREKDRNAIARAVIDYVMSNKHLFEVNVKNHNGILKIQTSVIRKLLRYLNLSNQYIDTRMGSIVLTIRTLLEVSGYKTELKRAMGRMNSIIYAYEDGGDGNPWVPEAGEKLLNPPAKPRVGGEHDRNKSNLKSNPGTDKVRENKEEDPNNEEQQDTGTGHNGVVGVTSGVRTNVGGEGGRYGDNEVQNSEGGRTRTSGETRGGHK
jgi:hypothetical protein